jgi:N-acetylneuraminate synthase
MKGTVDLTPGISLSHGSKPYIIAEIGANHNGDMELARKHIASAAKCGAHAAKFQSWTTKSLICRAEYEANTSYDDSPKKHFGSLEEMVERYYLRPDQHHELAGVCEEHGVDFVSTPFSEEEVDLLMELEVPFLKAASMDINNLPLLRYMARTGRPLVLSTGMATLGEIDRALETVAAAGADEVVLLHCISIYPPKNEDIHLRNIPMLHDAFGVPVGLSDHSIGTSVPLAAVALGACLIEKHFTLDKDLEGWDHEISADPAELVEICGQAEVVHAALGNSHRTVSQAELEKRLKFRRSIVAARTLPAGTKLKESDFAYKRPGTGFPPSDVPVLVGRTTARDLDYDHLFTADDFA